MMRLDPKRGQPFIVDERYDKLDLVRQKAPNQVQTIMIDQRPKTTPSSFTSLDLIS